jgi:hypothetical protein
VYLHEITLTGATQFANSIVVATFLEATNITTLDPSIVPRIHGYSYNSLGAAQTITVALAPTTSPAVNDIISLEAPTDAVNNFTYICGRDGILVPRVFGRQNDGVANQNLTAALGTVNSSAPFVMLFTTTAKDNTGTFRVWYSYANMGGSN